MFMPRKTHMRYLTMSRGPTTIPEGAPQESMALTSAGNHDTRSLTTYLGNSHVHKG